uniref:RNA-directed DNA polymerase, eukaryota, reverse transcriptase zinc-binding domain protein n=1 Tax=Tanacetum cinerariifolium TaxID=118510 RepID=A0A6L2JS59_TANCI|nr:RNA-directed DNA polymerase, eukaryota, reverse transcriptase zinc-binding domain protein [Tanacetum cinerariifolium]
MCIAVEWFFTHNSFSRGCNASFISLIPKVHDPKSLNDFRPISLIGSLYKVVSKILAMRLSLVIPDLISDVQTAFLPNRQILDGPFIINELLSWCKHRKQQAMVFKVDFAKAYDSIRLTSGMASILVNGSPTSEFQFHYGLKQGDPLAPFLFILVMKSLHLSVSRAIEAAIFLGIKIDPTLSISHLFYADDAVFIGVGVASDLIIDAAGFIGCSIMKAPFKYLGVLVGGNMSKTNAWDETVGKVKSRLSKWKLNTLSIGGRFTLLKSVLGSTPIFTMSLYKVPKSVLCVMESIRRNFFNGSQGNDRKISWVKWSRVLASKNYGGLGVLSFYALNRAILFKWVWRFISQDNSLWYRFISAMHGTCIQIRSPFQFSNWMSIIREVYELKNQGVDFLSHCKLRVGSGTRAFFWKDIWLGDVSFCTLFPRLYALENCKDYIAASKLQGDLSLSFRRPVRGGAEAHKLESILEMVRSKVLSDVGDRWVWDLNAEGVFRVKEARDLLDEVLLPKENIATRWIKTVPIKVNIFVWKLYLDRIPTRSNLVRRGVQVSSTLCPVCNVSVEGSSHLFSSCDVATSISRLICRWWNLPWTPFGSYSEWLEWFKYIRLGSKCKGILEGVFYVSCWCLWKFRNQLLFVTQKPRKDVLFDDIVSRSFTWSLYRSKHIFSWDSWLQHPYLIDL